MLMRIFTPSLYFQCVFNDFQCVITLLRALSVALLHWRLILKERSLHCYFHSYSSTNDNSDPESLTHITHLLCVAGLENEISAK